MDSRTKIRRFGFPIAVSCGITVLLFWKVFLGYIPFPGDYLIAWYEPWRTETSHMGSLGIAHKPVLDDVFRQFYPYRVLIGESIKNGSLPFWNPYNGNGMPFLATMQTGFFTPATLLFLALSGPLAWTIYIAIQPLIFSLGCYWYTRKLGLSRIASAFSIIVFLLSGFAVVRYEFGIYMYVASGLPYLLAIIEDYRKNTSTKLLFFIPFIICFIMVSGHPQMIFYVLLLSTAYAVFLCVMNNISIVPFALSYMFGFGLSAIQLVPTLELYMHANMTNSASQFIFDRFLLPIQHFISLFIPNYFGNPATYNFWEKGDYVETILYVGMIPIFFVIILMLQRKLDTRKYLRLFYGVAICLTFLLTINWPLSRWIYSLPIPIIGTGTPSRIFFLTIFSIAILAGLGFDCFLKEKIQLKRPVLISIGIVCSIIVFTLISKSTHVTCVESVVHNCWIVALRNTTVRNTILECLFFSGALVCVLAYKRFGRIIGYGIIALFCISGLYNANKFLPFSSYSTVMPDLAVIRTLKNISGYNRIAGIGGAELPTDIATYFHFLDPQYYEPLYLRRYGELFSWAKSQDKLLELSRSDVVFNGLNTNNEIVKKRITRLMQLVSVGDMLYKKDEFQNKEIPSDQIVWEDQSWVIVKNSVFLPRISIVPSYEYIPDDGRILQRLFDTSFDPSKSIVLEENAGENEQKERVINTDDVSIRSFSDNKNEITVRITSSFDGFLMLTDNYYPGWRAYVDSKEVKIYRANYTFRAIRFPKGTHDVDFRYQPVSFTLGSIISGVSLIMVGIYFVIHKKNE